MCPMNSAKSVEETTGSGTGGVPCTELLLLLLTVGDAQKVATGLQTVQMGLHHKKLKIKLWRELGQ